MNIINMYIQYKAGRKSGIADAATIDAWNAAHHAHHHADPKWSCTQSKAEMEKPMKAAFEAQTNVLFKAGYVEVMDEWYAAKRAEQAKADPLQQFRDLYPGMSFVAVEIDGDEDEEELSAKALRAIQEDQAFQAMVSETENDTKEGK